VSAAATHTATHTCAAATHTATHSECVVPQPLCMLSDILQIHVYVYVCCDVLQCVAVCCIALQCVAVCMLSDTLQIHVYGVATISRLLKTIGLFC